MNKDELLNLYTEQVDARQANFLREQVGEKQVKSSREIVSAEAADLLREQVGDRPEDLCPEQVVEMMNDLLTDQVDEMSTDLLTEQVDAKPADLLTEQVKPLKSLSETQWRIVFLCEVPRTLAEIMAEIGVGSRHYFKIRHLDPLIKGNVIKMTNPENPRAANQDYVLTETGIRLKINKPKGKS